MLYLFGCEFAHESVEEARPLDEKRGTSTAPYSGQEGTDGRTTKMNDVSLNEIAPPRQDWLGEVGRYFPNQIQNEQEVHKLTKGSNCSEYTDLITQCFVVVFSSWLGAWSTSRR